MTLRRQFPAVRGRRRQAVREIYRRLGPIQTQVPRAAFIALASRIPGVGRDDIVAAFEDYDVVKATNLRGTVHTSNPEQHQWLSAASQRPRSLVLRNHLALDRLEPSDVTDEIERWADEEWRPRKAIVEHMRDWLATHESARAVGALQATGSQNLVWGHPALIRRPADQRWETRTDTLHRTAAGLLRQPTVTADEALEELVRLHLGSYGPATRRDIAWWAGDRLTRVDEAVTRLGDEIVRLDGPDRTTYLDLAEPPRGGSADPGLRLLPEYDGLLLGYEGPAHGRFIEPEHLPLVWSQSNGLLSSLVLHDGRLVASWRLRPTGSRHVLEVTMLPGFPRLTDDLFAAQVDALEKALAIDVADVVVGGPP